MNRQPVVGILMGSDSDLPVMKKAAGVLCDLDIPFEMRIMSAHRTPEEAASWAQAARGRGIKVIIAGAGLAAHLAGSLAAHTTLPVIGVPLASGALSGLDALLATVQMPSGIPVATVAVDGAKNAAFLAAAILAVEDSGLAHRLQDFRRSQKETVGKKDRRLQESLKSSAGGE